MSLNAEVITNSFQKIACSTYLQIISIVYSESLSIRLINSLILILSIFWGVYFAVNQIFIDKYPLIHVEASLQPEELVKPVTKHYIREDIGSDLEDNIVSEIEESSIVKEEDFAFLQNHYTNTTKKKFVLRLSPLPGPAADSESPYDSDTNINNESKDILTLLDHKQFYKNLNNSSQYLRRDSFSK